MVLQTMSVMELLEMLLAMTPQAAKDTFMMIPLAEQVPELSGAFD